MAEYYLEVMNKESKFDHHEIGENLNGLKEQAREMLRTDPSYESAEIVRYSDRLGAIVMWRVDRANPPKEE